MCVYVCSHTEEPQLLSLLYFSSLRLFALDACSVLPVLVFFFLFFFCNVANVMFLFGRKLVWKNVFKRGGKTLTTHHGFADSFGSQLNNYTVIYMFVIPDPYTHTAPNVSYISVCVDFWHLNEDNMILKEKI